MLYGNRGFGLRIWQLYTAKRCKPPHPLLVFQALCAWFQIIPILSPLCLNHRIASSDCLIANGEMGRALSRQSALFFFNQTRHRRLRPTLGPFCLQMRVRPRTPAPPAPFLEHTGCKCVAGSLCLHPQRGDVWCAFVPLPSHVVEYPKLTAKSPKPLAPKVPNP